MSNNKQRMKKIIIAILLIGMVSSCEEQTVQRKKTTIVTGYGQNPIDIIVIEGCEYLEFSQGRRYSLCHKGNCKNPIHKGGNSDQR